MIMSLSERFCTVQEAAGLIERSIAQVTRYCNEGKLVAEFIGDRWFIDRDSVDHFKKPRRGNPNWVKGYTRKTKKKRK